MKPRKKFFLIETRDQLFNWLEQNAPTATIRRAFNDGVITNLGWFEPVSGSLCPGWVVRIKTRAGVEFSVAVVADVKKFEYRTYVLNPASKSFSCYKGGHTKLFAGDD